MQYSWSSYFMNICFWNLLFCLICAFCVLRFLFEIVKHKTVKIPKRNQWLITVIVAVFLLTALLPDLNHGSMHLLYERSEDVQTAVGVVEKINEPSQLYTTFKGPGKTYGADIIIDGQHFFVPTAEELYIGEWVELRYLPNSRCVLQIQAI